jgi:Outer membrane lipoprotein-sorting protein
VAEKLVGTETRDGKKVYKLEDHPINHPYYSKVISYVATDSLLPVERDFYDRAGKLFKIEHCTIETVDGVPTITKIVMKNVQSGGSSEMDVTKVIRNKQIPADIFDPEESSPHRGPSVLEDGDTIPVEVEAATGAIERAPVYDCLDTPGSSGNDLRERSVREDKANRYLFFGAVRARMRSATECVEGSTRWRSDANSE